jgi:AAA domain
VQVNDLDSLQQLIKNEREALPFQDTDYRAQLQYEIEKIALIDDLVQRRVRVEQLIDVHQLRSPPHDLERIIQEYRDERLKQSSEQFNDLISKLRKVFEESETASMQQWELIRLAKSTKITIKALTALYDSWRDDQDAIEPLTLEQFRSVAPQEREWLIANVLPARTTGVVHSEAGCGKTLLFYDFAKAIASGKPWNGYPTKQGKVLIVQTDEPASETSDRFEVNGIFEGVPSDQILVLTRWGFSQIRKLQRWIETYQPALVMIDSLTTANRRSTAEEKDSPYGHCLSDLRDLADRYGCTIWVMHHSNRQGGLRGTTAIEANVSEVWRLHKPDRREDLDQYHRVLEVGKSRSGCSGNYLLRLDVDDYSWEWLGEHCPGLRPTNPSAELLSFMVLNSSQWFEPEELAQRGFGGGNREAVRKQCERLKRKGLLRSESRAKSRDVGATRFNVYQAVVNDKKPEGTPSLDADQNASSENVQRENSLLAKDLTSLDADSLGHTDSKSREHLTIRVSQTDASSETENPSLKRDFSLDAFAGRTNGNVQREREEWCLWTKINTQVEVLEVKGDRARIRVPGEQRIRWVSLQELELG